MRSKITVVTVTYNCVGVLPDTMRSIFSQTYPVVEYILIDGGSTDGTVEFIQQHEKQIQNWISEPDRGIFDAMNKGLERATGEWILFMNAGDGFASPTLLEEIFSEPISPTVGCIHGQTLNVNLDGSRYKDTNIPFYRNPRAFRGMGINHQSIFVRTELARLYPFDLSFKIAADYNMINKIYLHGFAFKEVPQVIAWVDTTGVSAQNRRLQRLEEARICGCENEFRFRVWTNYQSFRAGIKRILMGCRILY